MRYGIIGSGMMGLEHLRNLQAIDGAVVTAVADPHGPSRDWASALAAEVGDDLTCFEHHGALIESGLCDAVVVASPNMTHAAILDDVLGAMGTVKNMPSGHRTSTLESKTNFFAGGLGPKLTAVCKPLHIGRTTMVWQTTISNSDGRTVAIVTQTQIVIPTRDGSTQPA